MKKKFKEIKFDKSTSEFQFDLVNFEDILKLKPTDHSQFEFHKVSFYVILLFTENKGQYNLNFKDYTFEKRTLFTLRKDNIHKFYKSDAKGTMLVFSENFIVAHTDKQEAAKIFLLFNEMLASPKLQLTEVDYQEITTLIDLIKQEYFGLNDSYSPSIIRNFFQIIITKLFRIKSKDNIVFDDQKYLTMFLQFQSLVEKECFNHKKVSFFAKEMGVTSKTLNNVTQSIIHKSAKALINDVVIVQSKRLIINSPASLTEIAYQVGFKEPTNFFKYFRKNTGVSPSEFRASCQK